MGGEVVGINTETFDVVSLFLLSSCLGDLDTLPLDDNELVGEKVYSTPEGYIGRCV